jgi:hypothetical protein
VSYSIEIAEKLVVRSPLVTLTLKVPKFAQTVCFFFLNRATLHLNINNRPAFSMKRHCFHRAKGNKLLYVLLYKLNLLLNV